MFKHFNWDRWADVTERDAASRSYDSKKDLNGLEVTAVGYKNPKTIKTSRELNYIYTYVHL